ncbi:MAG: NAD(P)H nitroreductase [Nocardioidaceae bacterium]|nr:NAD(P)H nitroreductase [Nocardioidaceae bacterium]
MTEITDRAVDTLIRCACRAPSVHNTQPWHWHVHDDGVVDLYADHTRQLVQADPQRRDLVLSCGAALHHLQVAARALGLAPRVHRLPEPDDERFVARVRLTPADPPPDAERQLAVIEARRTDRRRLTSWPVPVDRLNALAMAGNQWGAQVLPVVDERARTLLGSLTRRADELQRRNAEYRAEIARWTTYWGNEGVPAGHIPREASRAATDVLTRRFDGGVLDDPALEDEPPGDGLLLVCTSSDDPLSRVRAGETMSAVWLRATSDDLAVVPLSQALEVDETREALQTEVLDDLAQAQIVLRVGWQPLGRADLPATPRRDLADVRTRG